MRVSPETSVVLQEGKYLCLFLCLRVKILDDELDFLLCNLCSQV